MKIICSFVWLFAVLLCLVETVAMADLKPRKLEKKEVVGTWVGYESGGAYFYRLDLRNRGTGSCVVLNFDSSHDNYMIEDWDLDNAQLFIKLSPSHPDSEPIAFAVNYTDNLRIELTIKGLREKWERKAILYHEKQFLQR